MKKSSKEPKVSHVNLVSDEENKTYSSDEEKETDSSDDEKDETYEEEV